MKSPESSRLTARAASSRAATTGPSPRSMATSHVPALANVIGADPIETRMVHR